MGRGTITGGGDKGQYHIDFDYGEATAAALIASLQDRKARLEAEIAEFDQYIQDGELAYFETLQALDAQISAYNVSDKEDSDKDDLNLVAAKVLAADKNLRITTNEQGMLKLELGNVTQEIKYLQGKTFSDSRQIWCADYTIEATGSVATIEVNGEQPLALIAPGGRPPSNSDGNMFARELQSASQVYFNAALLPGWQKFQPTYRSGQITALNRVDDTCSVRLDTATSSAQGLNINQDSLLTGVPIEYMTCNAAAFVVWDYVVVQFVGQNLENPKVIGFVDNPKACAPSRLFFYVERYDQNISSAQGAVDSIQGNISESLDDTSSFVAPGHEIGWTTRENSDYYNGHVTDPDPTNHASTSPEITQDDVRVRFDVYWGQDSVLEDFTYPLYLDFTIGDVKINNSVETEYVSQCLAEANVQTQYYNGAGPTSRSSAVEWTYDSYPISTGSARLWKFYYESLGGPKVWEETGTLSGVQAYTHLRNRWYVTEPESELGEYDKTAQSDFLTGFWDMPDEIEVEVDGVFQTYVFERFGLCPDFTTAAENEEITVDPTDPPAPNGGYPVVDSYDVYWPDIGGVVYKLKVLP